MDPRPYASDSETSRRIVRTKASKPVNRRLGHDPRRLIKSNVRVGGGRHDLLEYKYKWFKVLSGAYP